MSPFAEYHYETFGFGTIERDGGFIVFDLKPPEASIEDFYVPKEKRGSLLAKSLADEVMEIARTAGCERMWAKVTPGLPGAEHVMRTNLHYGFKLAGVRDTDVILVKEIGGDHG